MFMVQPCPSFPPPSDRLGGAGGGSGVGGWWVGGGGVGWDFVGFWLGFWVFFWGGGVLVGGWWVVGRFVGFVFFGVGGGWEGGWGGLTTHPSLEKIFFPRFLIVTPGLLSLDLSSTETRPSPPVLLSSRFFSSHCFHQ